MKKILVLLFSSLLISSCSNPTSNSTIQENNLTSVTERTEIQEIINNVDKQDLTQVEKTDLTFLREEEKLARDVYMSMYTKWNHYIFNNISTRGEQTHTDFVALLLEKYSLEDPVKEDIKGKFTNQDLQKLYEQLVEQGNKSLEDAIFVGLTIEDKDIKDLNEAIERTDNEDIKIIYERLLDGSKNYLRSFNRLYEYKYNKKYTAQYITEEDLIKIINN